MASKTMQAIRLTGPCDVDQLTPTTVAKPTLRPGEAKDLPVSVANDVLRGTVDRTLTLPIAHVYYGLSEVGQAQDNLEHQTMPGKHVVVLSD